MTSDVVNITENLRLGIKAARTGDNNTARMHLATVLKQDNNNVSALFWLAFVAPSAQESLRLLERVLVLEPDNERVEAGMRWAKQRLEAEQAKAEYEPEGEADESTQGDESSPEMPDEFIRDQLLSKEDFQKRAKKGALAHRARRTIDPLLAVIIILGASFLLTVEIWAVALTPGETLAAWFPASTEDETIVTGAMVFVPPADIASSKKEVSLQEEAFGPPKQLAADSDTIIFKAPEPVETILTGSELSVSQETAPQAESPTDLLAITDESSELITPAKASSQLMSRSEVLGELGSSSEELSKIAPALSGEVNSALEQPLEELIDSAEEILNGPRLFEPVDESLLAHKLAFPDEKWIEVNVTTQRVTAWEGDVPVMSYISSTGLPGTPTVLGEFNIYWKLKSTLMAGADYYLPEVPYTMYFYGGYALHGTYWHDNFGQPMSHGCVNLSVDNAQQLFEWADPPLPTGQTQVISTQANPGALVVVHL